MGVGQVVLMLLYRRISLHRALHHAGSMLHAILGARFRQPGIGACRVALVGNS